MVFFSVLVLLVDLCSQSGLGVETAHLVVDIVAVVLRHLHAPVNVLQRRVRHLQRLLRNGTGATQVRLVTLVLENRLFPELDPELLFELLNHRLEELELQLLFLDFQLHLSGDAFFNPPLVVFTAVNLVVALQIAESATLNAALIEFLTEGSILRFMTFLARILFPEFPDVSGPTSAAPPFDPAVNQDFNAVVLNSVSLLANTYLVADFLYAEFLFEVDLVHLH